MQLFLSNAKAMLKDSHLIKIEAAINWGAIDSLLMSEYFKAVERKGGRKPYSYQSMLKVILLQHWLGFSYPKMAKAICHRFDYLIFCGFDLDSALPDKSTICRFKAKLDQADILDKALAEIYTQLSSKGLKVKCYQKLSNEVFLSKGTF